MSAEAREAEVVGVDAGVSVNPAPTQPERHDILQETIQWQQAKLQEFRRRCREQDEELRRLRQKSVEAPSPAEGVGRQIPLQNGYDSTASEKESIRCRDRPSSRPHGHVRKKACTFTNSYESDESEAGDRVRGEERPRLEGDQMTRYMKCIALPEVQPYSGKDPSYTFGAFLEAFNLKYPPSSWSDAEFCALFRSKLGGKAKNQYEVLPRSERERGFAVLVEAMKRESRTETRNEKLVALGELKRLRKQEGQTVSDFCVDLERLTRRAYPELDERALTTERAHLLYQQLAHWTDSYHLIEALEMRAMPILN